MSTTDDNEQQPGSGDGGEQPTAEDLALLNDVVDENRTDEEIWAEMDAEEAAAEASASGKSADKADSPDEDDAAAAVAKADNDGQDDDDEGLRGQQRNDSGDGNRSDQGDRDSATDIWDGASDDQRAAHEAATAEVENLKAAQAADRNRISGLTRKINQLIDQNRSGSGAGAQQSAAAPDRGGNRQGSDTGDKVSAFLKSDKWKGFEQEYPEVASPLSELVEEMRAEMSGTRQQVQDINEDRTQAAQAAAVTDLTAELPNWRTIAADQDGFWNWVETQPRLIQEAAARNEHQIVDATETAYVLRQFEASRSRNQGNSPGRENGQGDGSGGAPTAKRNGNGKGADTGQQADGRQQRNGQGSTGNNGLSGKRRAQLESSSASRSHGPGAGDGIPEDATDEEIWAAMDRVDAQRQRNGQEPLYS